MKSVFLFVIGLVLMAWLSGCGEQEVVQDIVTAYPDQTTLVLENDYVRAVEFSLQPGEKLPLHAGGPRVVYALSDYTIRWTEGGEVSEKSWKEGNVHWHSAIDHAVKNTGDTEAVYLVVTRKETPLPEVEGYDLAQDASQMDAEHASVLLDNEHVRVIRIDLPAGEKQQEHHGVYRLVYALNDYNTTYTSDKMGTKEFAGRKGTAHWHEPDAHAVENTGETTAMYVLFEFKK